VKSTRDLFSPSGVSESFLLPIGGVTGDEKTDRVLAGIEVSRHLGDFAPEEMPNRPDALGDDAELYELRRRNATETMKGDLPALKAFNAWFGAVLTAEGTNAKRLAGLLFAYELVRGVEGSEPEEAAREIAGFVKVKYDVDVENAGDPRRLFLKTQRLDVCSATVRHALRPRKGT